MTGMKKTVGIFTLGCKVNQYESEAIAERFERHGFALLPPQESCDFYVINTCTVTAESDRKARQMIRRAAKRNPKAHILVTGCMAQTAPHDIAAIEGVDYICGNTDKLSVVDAALRLLALDAKPHAPELCVESLDHARFEPMHIRKFDRTRAYIKIEDGCESRCTYCIIPTARGPIRSKPMDEVLFEVERLTEGGCREIVLTGIETGSYGRDLENTDLAELLERIDRLPSIGRVRLGSLDPAMMKPEFVRRISTLRSLAPHFHLSMQSGSDAVLHAMKRKYNTDMALRHIEALKQAMPRVMLTTDIIVGFPGETEEDFQKTLEFAANAEFLMIHVFPYSARRGTPAAAMSNQVPMSVRHERASALSALEANIRRRLLEREIARHPVTEVLFEETNGNTATGHTDNFIEVGVQATCDLRGKLAPVRLLSTDGEKIVAELISCEGSPS